MQAHGRTIATLALLGLALMMSLSSGCVQQRRTGGSADAVALYEMGRTDEAYRAALREHRGASGAARERAALTAGLSAHRLGRDAEASRWLRPLEFSRDDRVAGRADATLGLIAMDASDHDRAARLLERASRKLTGEAGARAQYHTAEAYALAGRPDAARLHMRLALARTTDGALKDDIRRRLGVAGYTIQIGAFSSMNNARRAADSVRSSASRLGLGDPQIVEHTSATGMRLHLVHVGRFTTADDARAMRTRMGNRGVVTPINR
ncbi:MAG: hypothetical protein Tsb0013_19680 [Phycisphaerales bacterium]